MSTVVLLQRDTMIMAALIKEIFISLVLGYCLRWSIVIMAGKMATSQQARAGEGAESLMSQSRGCMAVA